MLSTETINIGYLLARVELLYLDPILSSERDNNRDDVDAGPAYSPDDQKRFPENQDLRESA